MEIDKKEEAYSKIYLKTLNFLSYRKRSTKEISDRIDKYLKKIILPSREKVEIREKVLSTLESDGYLKDSNDKDFSKHYINTLEKSGKTFNRIKIYQFLNKRGVPKNIIENALDEIDSRSIYDSVLSDAQKKLNVLREKDSYLKKKKLINYLYRKGYPFDIVSSVVDTLL
jgi:regulatory protein